ncbi:hypothetical protein FB451DRAFT_1560669 [Mycena latifolia]|nr:hypothetical protein FB451DRAFT_1560669 [Mycena latifolia]
MHGSYLKTPLLLVGAVFFDRANVPPALPLGHEQMRTDMHIGWYEALIARPMLPLLFRVAYWAFAFTEMAVFLSNDPQRSTSHSLTNTFVLGTSLVVAGASIRLRCFRELGWHYTFALTLRDDHALITTGPYAVVRHPAYTGGIMMIIGAALALLGPGSWLSAAGYTTPWGALLASNFVSLAAIFMYSCTRGAKEEAYLAKTFGQKWERFVRDVPCRYFPGIC